MARCDKSGLLVGGMLAADTIRGHDAAQGEMVHHPLAGPKPAAE